MSRVLITGGAGFIGAHLAPALLKAGHGVRIAKRTPPVGRDERGIESVAVGTIDGETDWSWALEGIDLVVHLAGRAHVMHETEPDARAAYFRTNVEGTRRLAEMAAAKGIARLVFLSSIKVNGERTAGAPFTETDTPAPEDDYGQTKWRAERTLSEIAVRTGLQTVILRPPLVYGPGVKGNFLTLLKACAKGLPLPLGAIHNRRSFVYVGNLVDAVITCLFHDNAAGQTFLIRDGNDVSTPALIRLASDSLDVRPRLIPIPPGLLRLTGALTGRGGAVSRLTDSLVVDDAEIRSVLGWMPPYSMVEGLNKTAAWLRTGRADI
ncbi:MAG: SDR family oxidoreductase [Rhodospirillales bacterium]